jgi:nucleotide-binding universal stress UspA family protein
LNTATRPILVGLDATGRADPALSAALELGKRLGAPVRGLHAVPPLPVALAGGELIPVAAGLDRSILDAWDARVRARIGGRLGAGARGFELATRFGSAASILLDEATAHDARLIVLGPHQKRGLIDFGRTARAVLAGAPCSVWQQVREPTPVRRVLAAVDLSDASAGVIATARDLCALFSARLEVLFVFQPPDPALLAVDEAALPANWDVAALRRSAQADFERLLAGIDWKGVPHESTRVEGQPADEILARARQADLLVLGTHGRGRLLSFVLGSVAYAVLRAAEPPVLALRGGGSAALLG